MEELVKKAYEEAIKYTEDGELADYIPELAKEDKHKAALYLIDEDGKEYGSGDYNYEFTIQSIAKIVSYDLLLENYDLDYVHSKIGFMPTAQPFNSMLDLELANNHYPVNPYVNAGAMSAIALLYEVYEDDVFDQIMKKIQTLTLKDELKISEAVFQSELETTYGNRALLNKMIDNGVVSAEIDFDVVLETYIKSAAALVSTKDLARLSHVFSNPEQYEELINPENARLVRTMMAVAGTYNSSGDFAVQTGLPAKSGVGGGLVTAHKNGPGLATYCPGLDEHGNSLVGTKMIEIIARELDLGIY